jgi:ABC-type antimicrobial peptide transport system permease subunit
MDHRHGTVVGIIKDFHAKSLHEPIAPFFIRSGEALESTVSVKLSTEGRSPDHLSAMLTRLETAWKAVYPNKKFEYSFFDETIARLYEKEQKTARIMNIAMAIAIFISCMGLFGLAAFIAEQRTKEIGIRKVLGASLSQVVLLISQDFIVLVGISCLIASPLAFYFLQRWLNGYYYRVELGPGVFIISAVMAMVITIITIGFQTLKAAVRNPVESLRTE